MRDLFASTTEYGQHFETGVPVDVAFIRNTERAPKPRPDDRFQQRLEPAGRFMVHNPDPGDLPRGWERGVVHFDNPLVIWFNTQHDHLYDKNSWKAQLAKRYRARGKKLTQKLVAEGYDGIVTVMPDVRDTREIIDLTWFHV